MNVKAWMVDLWPNIFDPFNIAALLGGFMAIISYFKPGVGLWVFDLFFPPKKQEITASSATILTSLQKRQFQAKKLNEWNDLNVWSIDNLMKKRNLHFHETKVQKDGINEALQDLIGRKPRVTTAIAQRIRTCAEAPSSPVGNFDPFVANIMKCCDWAENSQTDPVQLLVVFVGAVWNPSCRNIVLDLKAVRGQFKDTSSIAFVFAPIPEGGCRYLVVKI